MIHATASMPRLAAGCSRCRLKRQLRLILDEAISTLEKTRHAFKSRDLADLRKRLQQCLEIL